MEKIKKFLNSIRTFVDEVGAELKKTAWPSRQELIESTMVVIVSVIMLGVFIGVCDKILIVILDLIIP